jgi:hypothetical protein
METKRNFEHFSTRNEQRIFREMETELMGELREAKINTTLSPENIMRYHHGAGWHTHGVNEDIDDAGKFESQSLTTEIKFEDILNQRMDVSAYFNKIADHVHGMQMRLLYKVVGESTDKSGNIVSTKVEGSIANSFLAMLRKIEFGVDRNGNVSMPQIHAGKEMSEKMLQELQAQGAEFQAEVEKVKAEKTAQALEREAERLARFKRHPDE